MYSSPAPFLIRRVSAVTSYLSGVAVGVAVGSVGSWEFEAQARERIRRVKI